MTSESPDPVKFKEIMCATAQRWKKTILSAEQPDVERAVALLNKTHIRHNVFVVSSPLEFYFAQAVIRGRITKKEAAEKCESVFEIDSAFLKPLTRSGGVEPLIEQGHRYYHHTATSIQMWLLRDFMEKTWNTFSGAEVVSTAVSSERRWLVQDEDATTFAVRLSDVDSLYRRFVPAAPDLRRLEYQIGFDNGSKRDRTHRAVMSVYGAISKSAQDIVNDLYTPSLHFNDCTQAEMISRMLGISNEDITWRYEIFHLVPAIMQFKSAFLLLGKKPEIHLAGENRLHNETGPAVLWPDKKKVWAIDGHVLTQFGEEIVTKPHTLTGADIDAIENEENRRIAIDRIGWERYLAEIKATVVNTRDNWVDNTVEALISPPDKVKRTGFGIEEPYRMLLSCRSTGRKYFLAVPRTVEENSVEEIKKQIAVSLKAGMQPWQIRAARKIKTCDDAQQWFADGAFTELLPYAKHKIRVIGAS